MSPWDEAQAEWQRQRLIAGIKAGVCITLALAVLVAAIVFAVVVG